MHLRTSIAVLLIWQLMSPISVAGVQESRYQGKTLTEWLEQLKDKDLNERNKAVAAIRALGPKAKAAVPALIGLLKDEKKEVRSQAAYALGAIGKEASSAVPALIIALKDKERAVRIPAVSTLGKFGKEARPAVAALIDTFKDEKERDVRAWITWTLGEIGTDPDLVVPALLQEYPAGEWGDLTTSTLAKFGKDAVPHIIVALKKKSKSWPWGARALARIGPAGKEAIPTLIELCKQREPGLTPSYGAVFSALASMGPEAKPAIPVMIDVLGRGTASPDVLSGGYYKICAAEVLGSIGPEAKEAVPQLTALLIDASQSGPYYEGSTRSARNALVKIGAPSVPALIDALKHKSPGPRANAALALMGMGAPAKAAVPALVIALKDEDGTVRNSAASALKVLDPPAAKKAGVAVAEEFRAVISKVEGNKVTLTKGQLGEILPEAITLSAAANVKVVKAKLNRETKKFEAGEPIEGGLSNELFTKRKISARITTNEDYNITKIEIRVLKLKRPP